MGFGQYSSNGLGGPNHVPVPHSIKSTRVKTVFGSHANTAHVWAQQTHEFGRSSDGRVFFHGSVIYSYGRHFKIAEFTKKKTKDGKTIVLFNMDKDSPSTGCHKGHARGALHGLNVQIVEIPNLTDWTGSKSQLKATHEALLVAAAKSFRSSRRAKAEYSGSWHERQGSEHLDSLRAILKTYRSKLAIPKDAVAWDDARKAKEKAALKKQEIANAKQSIANHARFLPGFIKTHSTVPDDIVAHDIFGQYRAMHDSMLILEGAVRLLKREKIFPTYQKMGDACVSELRPIQAIWHEAYEPAKLEDDKRKKLAALKEFDDEKDKVVRYWDARETANLWTWAVEFNKPQELIDQLARLTHSIAHDEWLPRAPRTPTVFIISPDQWRDGFGHASMGRNDYTIVGDEAARPLGTMVRRKNDRLETSRGAVVPWKQAVIAFRKAQDCRAKGTSWETNGEKLPVGTFQVDRIEQDGTIHAGCHTIRYEEMLRLAVREIPEHVRPTYPLPAVVAA